jgi:hypothetical protein
MKLIVIISSILLAFNAHAALEYHSERIKMMDVELLQQIITRNLKKLDSKEESPQPIVKQSLEILLAQPDQSLAASNYFTQLKQYSGGESEFLSVIEEIINEGIASLKQKSKDQAVLREQNTYLYILNNMVTELKEFKDQEFYKAMIVKIRDADIQIRDALLSYRLLNSMATAQNPSTYANTIIPYKKPWWKFW